jgi:phage regulator Rha-like protein
LNSAEKKALATTVAGVRQQTQFIALMEEWDDIENSVAELGYTTGYLNEQNEKWADSIEGIKQKYEEAKTAFINKLFDSEGDEYIKDFYKVMINLVE